MPSTATCRSSIGEQRRRPRAHSISTTRVGEIVRARQPGTLAAVVADPWTFVGESPSLGPAGGTVTLVEGSSFCISGRSGDMAPGSPQGLFFRDTRFLSRFELRVNGQAPEPLAADDPRPVHAPRSCSGTRPRRGPGRQHAGGLPPPLHRPGHARGHRRSATTARSRRTARSSSPSTPTSPTCSRSRRAGSARRRRAGRIDGRRHDAALPLPAGRRPAGRATSTSATGARGRRQRRHLRGDRARPRRSGRRACRSRRSSTARPIEPRYRCGQPVERATPVERLRAVAARRSPRLRHRPRRAARGASPAAPRTSARCASSTPTTPSGRSSPPARRGS